MGTKRKLINHQLTPVLLTDEGKIWIGMGIVSLSSHRTAGHVEFHRRGSGTYWTYSFEGHQWNECSGVSLKEEELEVLRLSAAGLTMVEIAGRMCHAVRLLEKREKKALLNNSLCFCTWQRGVWPCCNVRFLSRVHARIYIRCFGITNSWQVRFFVQSRLDF